MNWSQTRSRHRGFTLTELLVSIGLALIVLYGINRVFKSTADTVGTGMALSDMNRLLRAAQTTLHSDFEPIVDPTTGLGIGGMLPTHRQPGIIIRNESVWAYQNKVDQDNDTDGDNDPSTLNTDTTPTSNRFHRVDTISFFSGDAGPSAAAQLFQRRTGQRLGGEEQLVSELPSAAHVAWIHYGHLRLPDDPTLPPTNEANYKQPGAALPNRNNFYAQDWILGRSAIAMKRRDATLLTPPAPGYMKDAEGYDMVFFPGINNTTIPLAHNLGFAGYTTDGLADAPIGTASTATPARIYWSLYDVVGNDPFHVDGIGAPDTPGTFAMPDPNFVGVYDKIRATANWYEQMGAGTTLAQAYRFFGNPYIAKPMVGTSGGMQVTEKVAMGLPILMEGCTQFIVDVAGDFVAPAGLDLNAGGTGIQWYGIVRPEDPTVTAAPAAIIRSTGPNYQIMAWGPAELNLAVIPTPSMKPMLIRITVVVIDKNNRLPDGITREFIFRVPQ